MSIIGHMLNRTVSVYRKTNSTTAGRKTASYASHLSGVKARIHQLSGSELARYGAERGVNLWRVSVEPENDIVRTDRITFVDPDGTSHYLHVEGMTNSSNGFQSLSVIKVLECEEVTGGD